ncbi:oligosaccharide flippase family protein [Terrilactibacillus sp. S3-3]|nr:oligosaccharide flippase family protein [Terrilactibacillus sp. S3-3]
MIKNSFWSFSSTIGMQLIGLIGNIILARLLYPQLFGLLGMATIFSGLILVIQEAGFSSYIIYKKDLHKEYVTTSFWINIFVSVLLSSVLYILSGMISDFFNENGLKSIIILLCIGMIFSSLGITSRAVLTRKKEFDKLAIIDLISQLSSTIISIIFAFFSFLLFSNNISLFSSTVYTNNFTLVSKL